MSFLATIKSNPELKKVNWPLIPRCQVWLKLWINLFVNLFINKKGENMIAAHEAAGYILAVNCLQTNIGKKEQWGLQTN